MSVQVPPSNFLGGGYLAEPFTFTENDSNETSAYYRYPPPKVLLGGYLHAYWPGLINLNE